MEGGQLIGFGILMIAIAAIVTIPVLAAKVPSLRFLAQVPVPVGAPGLSSPEVAAATESLLSRIGSRISFLLWVATPFAVQPTGRISGAILLMFCAVGAGATLPSFVMGVSIAVDRMSRDLLSAAQRTRTH